MKILAIRIKNLASLEGITEIDFTVEPLKSAGIFAITGATGSGKSTLLDALCLALFAKTPRHENGKENDVRLQDVGLHLINQNDVKGILRKGCVQGYAEVDFIGIDGKNYRSKWAVNRAHQNVNGALQADTLLLTNLTENNIFPETRKTVVLKEIERLVGLNFAQFTRSVLLAQGEFTAFLKAQTDEKSALLEKLTGTDIYSQISKKVFENFTNAKQAYKDVEVLMGGILLLTLEEQLQLNQQKNALNTIRYTQDEELQHVVDDMNWHVTVTNLNNYKVAAKDNLDICENEKVIAKVRISNFNLVEVVQPARLIFTEKNTLDQQVTSVVAELTGLNKSIETLNIKEITASLSLTTAAGILLKNENDYLAAGPQIDEAKALDVVLQEKNKQHTSVAAEASKAKEIKEKHDKVVDDKQAEILATTASIESLQTWKIENNFRQPIAENHTIINSKLADGGKLLIQQKALETNLKEHQQKLEKVIFTIDKIKIEVDESNKSLEKFKAVNDIDDQAIAMIAIDTIKATEKALRIEINKIVPATACWNILNTNEHELASIKNKLLLNSDEINTKKAILIEQTNSCNNALVRQIQSDKILNEAILQTQKSVVDMRSQLTTESPCPVCGSKEHPFVTDNPVLNNVIESLKKEDADCKKAYKDLLVFCNTISTEISNIENNNINFKIDQTAIETELAEQNKTWVAFNMDPACLAISADKRLLWLQEQERKLASEHKLKEQELTNYQQLKDKITIQQTQISTAENQLLQSQGLLHNNEKDQQFITGDIKRIQEELTNCTQNITTLTNELDTFFNDKDWQIKWKMDAAGFIEKIDKFTTDWNSNVKRLEKEESKLQKLQIELEGQQSQQQTLNTTAINLRASQTCTEKEISDVIQQRKNLFNGDSITIVVAQYLQHIEQAKITVKKATDERFGITNQLIVAGNNKLHFENEEIELLQKIKTNNNLISEWLNTYNKTNPTILDEATITDLLAYTPAWITQEKSFLNLLDTAIIEAAATYNDRNIHLNEFAAIDIPKDTAEFLAIRLPELKQLITDCNTELTQIGYRFRQHITNETQLGSHKVDLDVKKDIYQNWHKLNDVIGSSDGKKFRQFAQEYTLDVLLGFANIHLAELANRYKLSRVPNSLALQVLDRDMGDEIRTVHSLSGGESFLVSLALALGLASLSSNKLKVESLFIDEGFGSLDPATLIIAMDALTKLQDQGRKVGVISHVAEMTENISTQIKIIKVSSGRSKLEVS